MRGINSTGITSTVGVSRAWKTGTIANTGGATSPLRCDCDRIVGGRGIFGDPLARDLESFLVAPLVEMAVVEFQVRRSGIRCRQLGELRERLVQLLDAVLLDGLAEGALDQRALEVAGDGELDAACRRPARG